MSTAEKKKAYSSDIIYLTAKQAGFDYLHDCLQLSEESRVHCKFEKCIVDEADFIMIDESRIPLVIAREKLNASNYAEWNAAAKTLKSGLDYKNDRVGRSCILTAAGINRVCEKFGTDELSPEGQAAVAGVNVALHAQYLLAKDVDYIVRCGRIELVDDLTGRIADKREWPYGIQRALEAKEKLVFQPEGEICGSITIENFIRLYPEIAAMTATAESAAAEFHRKYNLETWIIPMHKANNRLDSEDLIFKTRTSKMKYMLEMVKNVSLEGRPVLIGTSSVKESAEVSAMLTADGIRHNVLNAVNDAEEAEIIAKAGMKDAVTVSTNMAGRGTDILLGGPGAVDTGLIKRLGGLLVISLNRHESKRIDNQLRGRSGRQGDPGESRFLLSIEDRLFERYGIREFIPEKIMSFSEDKPVNNKRAAREIERAQEIIEDQHSKMRETLHRYTVIIEKFRKQIMRQRTDALEKHEFPEELISAIDNPCEVDAGNIALIYASILDEFWINYLDWVEHIREGIHLRRFGKREPIIEFIKDAEAEFICGLRQAVNDSIAFINKYGAEHAEALNESRSGSTWTYIIDDNPFPSFSLSLLGMDNAVSAASGFILIGAAPMIFCTWLWKKVKTYIKKR